MRTTKRKRSPRAKTRRASWKGLFTFGLVSFPIEAFNALNREESDIHFHQLHEECHRRIQYRKVCPAHGEVSNDEIVSGYEYQKGKYVEIDPAELDELRTESERALKIDAFVTPDIVDPIYFDGRMYYLMPADTSATEPYAVIVEAMEREERCGVGQVVFSGKEQIVLVRPLEGVLHMAMLNYDAEIRPAKSVAAAIAKPRNIAKEVRMAQTLIAEWSDDNFDFSRYQDHYREEVKKLIEAKLRGHTVEPPKEEEESPKLLNLMDALKKSISGGNGAKKKSRRHSA